ncbi:MAG: cob(I)yrinic acid a,c-diamide adenosyltransferase [Propionibacteriaceae bacterium]|jgi:cob(I)alamin adenosyltransferase|nr:cob(I)yrinic acid a,c-diamide adenosyltransferase [Propionibacteriaceae bacterium]
MVRLTRIYTRTGDRGQTRLVDNSQTAKTDPRIEAYGTVDELNAVLGLTLTAAPTEAVAQVLAVIQQELFDLGADLAQPVDPQAETGSSLRLTAAQVARLEAWCDQFGDGLPPLRSFVLPGGSPVGAWLHLARTVCRRAERQAWRAVESHGLAGEGAAPGGLNPEALTYLNRLSDLLFILSRAVTGPEHEILWTPGGQRPTL